MLLGEFGKGELACIEESLVHEGEEHTLYAVSQGVLRGRAKWVVVCVVFMVQARMMLRGVG